MMMDRWVHGGVPSDPSSVDRAATARLGWSWPAGRQCRGRMIGCTLTRSEMTGRRAPQKSGCSPPASSTPTSGSPFRRDETERSDGFRGTYAFVDKRNFALIIPAENGGFHLVEEYRYPLGRRGWSFPQAASRTTSPGRPRNWPGSSLPRRPACGGPADPPGHGRGGPRDDQPVRRVLPGHRPDAGAV